MQDLWRRDQSADEQPSECYREQPTGCASPPFAIRIVGPAVEIPANTMIATKNSAMKPGTAAIHRAVI